MTRLEGCSPDGALPAGSARNGRQHERTTVLRNARIGVARLSALMLEGFFDIVIEMKGHVGGGSGLWRLSGVM